MIRSAIINAYYWFIKGIFMLIRINNLLNKDMHGMTDHCYSAVLRLGWRIAVVVWILVMGIRGVTVVWRISLRVHLRVSLRVSLRVNLGISLLIGIRAIGIRKLLRRRRSWVDCFCLSSLTTPSATEDNQEDEKDKKENTNDDSNDGSSLDRGRVIVVALAGVEGTVSIIVAAVIVAVGRLAVRHYKYL